MRAHFPEQRLVIEPIHLGNIMKSKRARGTREEKLKRGAGERKESLQRSLLSSALRLASLAQIGELTLRLSSVVVLGARSANHP